MVFKMKYVKRCDINLEKPVCSVVRSVVRSVGRSVVRPVVRSVGRSTFARLIRASYNSIARMKMMLRPVESQYHLL